MKHILMPLNYHQIGQRLQESSFIKATNEQTLDRRRNTITANNNKAYIAVHVINGIEMSNGHTYKISHQHLHRVDSDDDDDDDDQWPMPPHTALPFFSCNDSNDPMQMKRTRGKRNKAKHFNSNNEQPKRRCAIVFHLKFA